MTVSVGTDRFRGNPALKCYQNLILPENVVRVSFPFPSRIALLKVDRTQIHGKSSTLEGSYIIRRIPWIYQYNPILYYIHGILIPPKVLGRKVPCRKSRRFSTETKEHLQSTGFRANSVYFYQVGCVLSYFSGFFGTVLMFLFRVSFFVARTTKRPGRTPAVFFLVTTRKTNQSARP